MLSIPDMAVLGGLALLLFGPEQLPQVARKAGNFMRDVQNTSQAFIREMERAADAHDAAASTSTAYEAPPRDAAVYAPVEIVPYPDDLTPIPGSAAHVHEAAAALPEVAHLPVREEANETGPHARHDAEPGSIPS